MNPRDELVQGATVWLTGLPSAGKSTIAEAAAALLAAQDVRVQVLDGDAMRRTLCSDLGFSAGDRHTNVRRVGFVSELLSRHGVIVLVPVIAPYRLSREEVREHHRQQETRYIEVYVDAPVSICMQRDVKGLYKKHRAGELKGLTGMDDPYEAPLCPELHLRTDQMSVDEAAKTVLALLGQTREAGT